MKYRIEDFTPFSVYYMENEIHLVFSREGLSIVKDKRLYRFIPQNINKIVVLKDEPTRILNKNIYFMFYANGKALRLSLKELQKNSDLSFQLQYYYDSMLSPAATSTNYLTLHSASPYQPVLLVDPISDLLEKVSLINAQKILEQMIDEALDNQDREKFMEASKLQATLHHVYKELDVL